VEPSNLPEPYPEPKLRDHLRVGADAAIAAFPLGGSVVTLLDAVIAPSLAKRRDSWLRMLGERLDRLEAKVEGFGVEDLADDELFVSAVMEASRIAVGTELEAKLKMLANCLERLAMPDRDIGDFLAMRFLAFVDELRPEHFLVLCYTADPRGWYQARGLPAPNLVMGPRRALLTKAGLPVAGDELDLVLRDLADRGLANDGWGVMVSENGLWDPLATDLGRQLLDFVGEFE
jgi:hypothetical protein